MTQKTILLPEVDQARVTIIMDNFVDLLMAGTELAQRFPLTENWTDNPLPLAEHGFSALVQVKRGDQSGQVLFDTGVSRRGILNNIDAIQIDLQRIQAIVLSHGHPDHALGLPGIVDRLGSRGLPLIVHPGAYLERRLVLPNGTTLALPAPKLKDYRRETIEVIEEVGPSMLVDNMILVSGEVARTIEFEKGFPIHQAKKNGYWVPDPLILDDQCVIMNVRDKGLVIVTGCGHSGIINIIRHAQTLTGVRAIYAVIGGFHLTGAIFVPLIGPTVAALEQIKPHYVMPSHCTGWQATQRIAQALPEAFIPNSVGTTLIM